MYKKNKKAFSFVEILIFRSILVIISVIGVTSYSKVQEKSINAKVDSDVRTIDSSLSLFKEEEKLYPMPDGNNRYYGTGGEYKHIGYDDDIWGVSGYITNKTLPKKYLEKIPLDPRTNQYYAYGITFDKTSFEVAGLNIIDDNFKSKLYGSYDKGKTESLIKEYAGPQFVVDGSYSYLPFNPHQRQLVAKINSFSGDILINDLSFSDDTIKQLELTTGDKITVSTGGELKMYFSDGSESILGNTGSKTEIVLTDLTFEDEANLITKIRISLNAGSILSKVSKLINGSEFEVYTKDAVASVRGTIFGVSYYPNETNPETKVIVEEGSVEVKKIDNSLLDEVESLDIKNIEEKLKEELDELEESDNKKESDKKIKRIKNIIKAIEKIVKKENKDNAIEKVRQIYKVYLIETNDSYKKNIEELSDTNSKIIVTKEDKERGETKNVELVGDEIKVDDDDWKLVAYAPYDKVGDIKMYKGSGNEEYDNVNSRAIITNNCYPKYNSSNGFFNDRCGGFYKNLDINGINYSFDVTNSFFSGSHKGIFLDNTLNDDHILYNLNNIGIGNNFGIEVQLRGGALKRNILGKKYTIFSSDNYDLYIKDGRMYLNDHNYEYGIYDINNKEWYKVKLTKESDIVKLLINNNEIGTTSGSNNLGEKLYIGSKKYETCTIGGTCYNYYEDQWNDIIDYVKIYTKD